MKLTTTLAALALALPLLANGETQAAQQIGVASAVSNQVEGFASGSPRTILVGSGVFSYERIRTGESGSVQLLFVDKTTVSIGPQAELMLDRFVYDPDRGVGQVVLATVKGSFRFITGSQNPNNYTIRTPAGTLGIRGTIVNILAQNDRTIVGVSEGAAKITLLNGQVLELLPFMAYIIDKNGNVQGPIPFNINDTAFASFDTKFSGDPANFNVPFGNIGGIDQLNGIDVRNFTPPTTRSYNNLTHGQ